MTVVGFKGLIIVWNLRNNGEKHHKQTAGFLHTDVCDCQSISKWWILKKYGLMNIQCIEWREKG